MKWQPTPVAWDMLWREEPGRLQSMGFRESDMTQWLNNHHHITYICIIYLYKILLMLCSMFPNSNIEVLWASFDYLFFLLVNGNSINSQVKKKKCTLFEPYWVLWPGKQVLRKLWEPFHLLDIKGIIIFIIETKGHTHYWCFT